MTDYAPLYIKPLGIKTTDEERRAGYEYARENLHHIEVPDNERGNWEYFTTDPTDRHAPVYSIARPDSGAESSRFGDNEYTAALLEENAARLTRDGDIDTMMTNYHTAHEEADKAEQSSQSARKFYARAKESRAAAQRIKKQWKR